MLKWTVRGALNVTNSATGKENVLPPGIAHEALIAEPLSPQDIHTAPTDPLSETTVNPVQSSNVFDDEVADIAHVHCDSELFEFDLSTSSPSVKVYRKGLFVTVRQFSGTSGFQKQQSCRDFNIFSSHGLLPSYLVAQSVERWRSNPKVVGSIPTLVRVFLCPCVGPVPSVGLTLTWFIWDRNLALHVTLHSLQLILFQKQQMVSLTCPVCRRGYSRLS